MDRCAIAISRSVLLRMRTRDKTVTMVFYSNLCFIVNLMPFTVSGQPFRAMFYVVMHFCDFDVVCVYRPTVCSLPVALPDLANKDTLFSTTC